jgi:DNA-binding CsgD family transcriptional regulator
MGTVLEDVISGAGASERNVVHRRVMESGRAESHFRMSLGARVLCTVYPLDEVAFGHRGIFAVSVDAPMNARLIDDEKIPILPSPNLHDLALLSTRELEVLHYVANAMSTQEIADHVSRASKTIEHHINSIHGKLGTHSRAQLVRFAAERGIHSFSDEEWASIVESSKRVRKELV